jgi:hypothetical protein
MTVYFVGDMLQSDDKLDLEKVRITDDNIAELLTQLVWEPWQQARTNDTPTIQLSIEGCWRPKSPIGGVLFCSGFTQMGW